MNINLNKNGMSYQTVLGEQMQEVGSTSIPQAVMWRAIAKSFFWTGIIEALQLDPGTILSVLDTEG